MKKIRRNPEQILNAFREIQSLEKKAERIYHQLSEDCDDPWAKERLEMISLEERVHAGIARKLVLYTQKILKT